jgi:hypothetical protein
MLLWALIGSFIVFLFYVLETLVACSIITVVVGGIMSLVYFNQNKLLYMPGTYSLIQSSPTCPFLHREILIPTDIPQSKGSIHLIWNSRLKMA